MVRVDELVKILTVIPDEKTLKRFFRELFTPAEIQDVALRWRLMRMLHEGIPQREIAAELGISLCKITRGSRVLKTRNSISKKILDQKLGVKDASCTKTGTFT